MGISKQAHAQNQVNLLKEQVYHKDILQAVAGIRLLHPMMGLKKNYHKLKPIALGRDQFIALAQSANLGVEKPKNYQNYLFY